MADTTATKPAPDPKAALEQTLGLLKARDDTSKFVGLSLLQSLLDANEDLRLNSRVISECWASIPNKFLTRLLTSRPAKIVKNEETKSLVQLSVSVVHLFANLLPPGEVAKEKMTEFSSPLVKIASNLDAEPQSLAFQTLQCIAASPSGAAALVAVKDWKGLAEAAKERPKFYLKEVARIFAVSQETGPMHEYALGKWHGRLEVFIGLLQKKDEVALIETLAELNAEFPVWCQSPSFKHP
jgi:hypothetical protein